MSDIAKCPICGKDVKKSVWRPEYEGCAGSIVVTVKCCGMEAVGIELWNQYAAAMDYSRKTAAWFRIDPEKAGGRLADQLAEELMAEAQRKMLEVFK